MCYIEENIRKQIEIAFLLTAFFRILLNKLPLCSASSYSWTSSRKSNLELIKKSATPVTRLLFPVLDRGCSADRPQPVFESSKDICQQKRLKSSNLSLSPGAILPFYVQSMKEKFPTLDDLTYFRHFFCTKNVKIVCTYETIREVAEMQEFFHFNFNQEKFTTGLKQGSADKTENVYLSFAGLLS